MMWPLCKLFAFAAPSFYYVGFFYVASIASTCLLGRKGLCLQINAKWIQLPFGLIVLWLKLSPHNTTNTQLPRQCSEASVNSSISEVTVKWCETKQTPSL